MPKSEHDFQFISESSQRPSFPASRRRPIRGYTPEALANAKHRYEDTDELQDSIATDLRISLRKPDKLAKRGGWKLRKRSAAARIAAGAEARDGRD